MLGTDLAGMRKLALVLGILLLTWAAAGISLAAENPASLLGIPFRLTRAELLPLGLALAAVYTSVRYYYFGLMLGTSPYRRRRDILDDLVVDFDTSAEKKGRKRMYGGPTRFTTSPWHYDRSLVEKRATELRDAFPKFANARVTTEVTSQPSFNDDGEEYWTHAVTVTIPIRCRVAALIEDLDYTLPIWLNVIALSVLVL